MPDWGLAEWIGVWGAVIGTVGAVIAVRREFLTNRARLRMEHGIWFLVRDDRPPDLSEAWVTIQVWNDGGQPLTVERVGLDLLPMWRDGEGENEVMVVDTDGCAAEIDLGGEQVELRPGGPSRKFFAPLLGLIQIRIDVLDSIATPWVRTSNRKRWNGDSGPVVPARVPAQFRETVRKLLTEQGTGPPLGVRVGLPGTGPPSEGQAIYS